VTDHAHPNAAPANAPATLGLIGADRPCATCGFNLHGQTITREPHYDLPIARCPECGTVAALQEYPALNRWAARLAALLAAAWLAALILLFTATTFFTTLQTIGFIQAASDTPADVLAQAQADWIHTLADDDRSILGITNRAYGNRWDPVEPQWPGAQHPGAVLAAHGGTPALIDWRVGWLWIGTAIFAFVAGALWCVALLHQPRAHAALVPIVSVLLAMGIVAFIAHQQAGSAVRIRELAFPLTAPIVAACTAAVLIPSILVGAFAGRALARLVVRMALPPRLRVPFAPLWTSASLPLPRPR